MEESLSGDIELQKRVLEGGNVTLRGDVSRPYQKDTAQADVRKIEGGRGVTNLITVEQSTHPSEVKRKIEEAVKRNADLEASHISVSATGGAVTLSGCVKTWHEREIAEQAALSVSGVTAVTDHLRVGA
jgi:osmotically-inducible protein OsmY